MALTVEEVETEIQAFVCAAGWGEAMESVLLSLDLRE
eukprot:gene16701-579_t